MILHPLSEKSPDVSVVIPTIPSNSHKEVVVCLENQRFDSFEVIVVNDASLDICEARNAGIEVASADIVALTDDDCRPNPDWLGNIFDVFDTKSNLVCLEGKVIGGRFYDGMRRYVGCNLAFDRKSALAIGGFSSDYAGWRDDTEFGWRMERDTNGRYCYSSSVVMCHPRRPRASINKRNEQLLKSEYPNRYENILIPDSFIGKMNDWLWRHGFWDRVDSIRDGGTIK